MSDIKRFLICGGGMMGSAIAQIFAGLPDAEVTVYDVYPVDVEAKVRSNMKLLAEKEIVTETDVDAIASKINFTQDMQSEGVKSAQLVVECVLEDMEMKQNLFVRLEEVVAEDTIFCYEPHRDCFQMPAQRKTLRYAFLESGVSDPAGRGGENSGYHRGGGSDCHGYTYRGRQKAGSLQKGCSRIYRKQNAACIVE